MNWTLGALKVVDKINLEKNLFGDVMSNYFQIWIIQMMFQIVFVTGEK